MLGRLTLAEKVKFRLGLPSTVIQIESIRWHRSPQGMKLEQCVIQCINPQISASEHEVHFLFIQSPKCGHLAHTSRGPFGDSGAFDFMPPPALCPHSTPGFQRHHLAGSEPAEGRALGGSHVGVFVCQSGRGACTSSAGTISWPQKYSVVGRRATGCEGAVGVEIESRP